MHVVEVPFGSGVIRLDVGSRPVRVARPPAVGGKPVLVLLESALARPIGAPKLEQLSHRRVLVIVSDESRSDPRREFVQAIASRMPAAAITVAIATGTHGKSRLSSVDVGAPGAVVNHDGHDRSALVTVGTTSRGTPVAVHRALLDHDLIIATGCIRPHYFAGFGGGAKAVFPGLGGAIEVRQNHALKTSAGARPGVLVGNPCREDIEEAVALVPTPLYLLNVVCGADDSPQDAVFGILGGAYTVGARTCRQLCSVPNTKSAAVVIASDSGPVTQSLYQASKIAAMAAPLVEPGGLLIVVASCELGVEPLDTIMRHIFATGIAPRFAGSEISLISALPKQVVIQTYATPLSPVDVVEKIQQYQGDIVVVPTCTSTIFS